MSKFRFFLGAAVSTVLGFSLGGAACAEDLPDIVAFSATLAGKAWTTLGDIEVTDVALVNAIQKGPNHDKCSFTGTYVMSNTGSAKPDASASTWILSNGIPVYSRQWLPALLGIGEWRTVTYDLLLDEGANTVQLYMDYDNDVTESDESNNSLTSEIFVNLDCNADGTVPYGEPPLHVGQLEPVGPSQPDLVPHPDGVNLFKLGKPKWNQTLVIDDAARFNALQRGPQRDRCYTDVVTSVANSGRKFAPPSVSKTYLGSELVDTTNHLSMNPSRGQFWNTTRTALFLKEGRNRLRLVTDANKDIAESDESNNTGLIVIDVQVDCNGDGQIGNLRPLGGALIKATPGHTPGQPQQSPRPAGGLKLVPAKPDPLPHPAGSLKLVPTR